MSAAGPGNTLEEVGAAVGNIARDASATAREGMQVGVRMRVRVLCVWVCVCVGGGRRCRAVGLASVLVVCTDDVRQHSWPHHRW